MKARASKRGTVAWLWPLAPVAAVLAAAPGCGGGGLGSVSSDPSARVRVPPPSALRSLELSPSPDSVLRAACLDAAREIEAGVVYCPPVAPAGKMTPQVAAGGFSGADNYVVDLQMDDTRSPYGHWLIEGGDAQAVLAHLRSEAMSRNRQRVGGVDFQIFKIKPYGRGGGQQGGHLSVYWRRGDRGYVVSFHDYDNRVVALAVAQGLIEQMERCPLEAAMKQGQRQGSACSGVFPAQSPLRPSPASLRRACQRIALASGERAYCPPVVPAGRLEIAAVESTGGGCGYSLRLKSPIFPGGRLGQWVVQGDEEGVLWRSLQELAQTHGSRQVAGLRARLVLTVSRGLGGGLLAKSSAVVWTQEGRDYLVAIKGLENEDLALEVADAMAREMRR